MKLGSRRTILCGLGMTLVGLLAVALAGGQAAPQRTQAAPEQKPQLSQEAFKNIQVLRDMPVSQFMETMGFFSASLGESCEFCHGGSDSGWDKYAEDNEIKNTARKMVLMMATINKTNFAGKREVTCYSCHHGGDRPKVTPSLAALYGAPPPEEPTDLVEADPDAPPADKFLDKYIQALGGAQKLAGINSFVAKGTTSGYGEKADKRPYEIYAKAPDERTVINHTLTGDSTVAFDGREGWTAAPDTDSPVPVVALTGQDLDSTKVDAALSFPGHIKQVFSKWVVGFPNTIDDREVQVVQGIGAGGTAVTFYFDSKTGLLVRQVRYTDSRIGRIPTQTDYSDYRDVAGVKMPFQLTITWLDGRSTIALTSIQANVPIDAAKFAKPAPPAPVATKPAAK
jgi:hypothetical protein